MPIVLTDVTTDYESAATTNKSGVEYLPGFYMEVKPSKKPAFEGTHPGAPSAFKQSTISGAALHASHGRYSEITN